MTHKEMGEVLSNMIILVDSREKKNHHILDYFDEVGIKYRIETLSVGDYTVEFGDSFSKNNRCVTVERKNSIDEICGNFSKNRDRFKREFERGISTNTKCHVLIEECTFTKIYNHSYRSKVTEQSLVASMLSFSNRYDINFWFCTKYNSGRLIYDILKYHIMEVCKNY